MSVRTGGWGWGSDKNQFGPGQRQGWAGELALCWSPLRWKSSHLTQDVAVPGILAVLDSPPQSLDLQLPLAPQQPQGASV